jgi:hypothetical protein
MSKLADRPPLLAALLVALAVLINAPYLAGGFSADDFLLIVAFERDPLPFSRWRGVWSTTELDAFHHLWWRAADSAGQFWRPLPSALFELSLAAFGRTAWPLHLLSLVAHGAVCFGVYLLVRGLTRRDTTLAVVAALAFLLCEDHSMGVGWIATFTDMLSLGLVIGGLIAHRAWLEHRRPAWLAAELSLFALALTCKESAVLAPVLAALMSVVAPRGVDDGPIPRDALRDALQRPAGWLPQGLLVAGFLAVYKAAQLGGMNNLMYMDPLAQPLTYARHLVAHMPVMWLATVSPVPPSLTMLWPPSLWPLAIAGALAMAGWLWLSLPLLRQPLYAWALGVYMLALLPQLGTDASERGLYQPWLGAAILLAGLLVHVWRPASTRLRLGGWAALLGVALPGAALAVAYPWVYTPSLAAPERHALTAVPHIRDRGASTVLFVTTAGMMDTLYPSGVLDVHLGEDAVEAWLLSSANARWTVERVGPRALVLRADRPGWLSNMFARLVRTDPAPPAAPVDAGPFVATVLEQTPAGDDALAVRFDLAGDPLLLVWTDDGYQPLDLTALPEGVAVPITDSSDLWRSMQ